MEIFDGKALEYDEWYRTPAGRRVDALEKAVVWHAARPRAGERALDVGCGTGNYSLALAKKGLTVTGVDVSTDMLAAAERKAQAPGALEPGMRRLGSIKFLRADAAALPFTAESFDLVLSVTAFEFIRDPVRAVAECWRVLRPGGRLVVAFIAGGGAWANLYAQIAANDEANVFWQARFWAVAEAREWLPGVGSRVRGALWAPPEWLGKDTLWSDLLVSATEAVGRMTGALAYSCLSRKDAANQRRRHGFCPGFVVLRWEKMK